MLLIKKLSLSILTLFSHISTLDHSEKCIQIYGNCLLINDQLLKRVRNIAAKGIIAHHEHFFFGDNIFKMSAAGEYDSVYM